jgi:hypothetical protein
MLSKPMNRRRMALRIWSSLYWVIPLLFGGLWLLLSSQPSEYVVAGTGLAVIGGFLVQRTRARAGRRQAALDAYAEIEIARAAQAVQRRTSRRLAAIAISSKP